jgi:ferric-dicitrate binding protein FerR (iron transport regulator)
MNPPDDIIIKRVLNNKGTAKEAEEVAAWFATQDGQHWLLSALETDSEDILKGYLPSLENPRVDVILKQILKRIDRQRRNRIIWTVAAAIIPCILIATMWIGIDKKTGGALSKSDDFEIIELKNGEQREIFFQDGSSVNLNCGSRLSFPHFFGLKSRDVYLEGEALFRVAHNSRRPFIVHIDKDLSVEVKGTVFNVNAYSDVKTVTVDLFEGSVVFHDGWNNINIAPEHSLSYNKETQKSSLSKLQGPMGDIPWVSGILVFKDAPINEMVSILQRQYGVVIDVVSESARQTSYSLKTQPNEKLEDIFKDMERVSSIKVRKISEGHYSIQ